MKHQQHPLYRVWINYRQRCNAQGIIVLWPTFEEFMQDRGKEYKKGRLLTVQGDWVSRKELTELTWNTRKTKLREQITRANRQTTMEQAFFLLNATKDDYETLVKLEPRA